MRKRRGDSSWSKLTVEQRKLMDKWYFDENLSYPAILEKADKEFNIKASKQTLTAYFRHREEVVGGLADWEEIEVHDPRARRVGAGMKVEDLEVKTLYSVAMAAYELSLAEPDQMRIKDIRSLMKMLNEHTRRLMDHKKMQHKADIQWTQMAFKVHQDESGKQTKEEYEEMLLQTADILHRARQKGAENRSAALRKSGEQTATSPSANGFPSPPQECSPKKDVSSAQSGPPKAERRLDEPAEAYGEKTTRCDAQDASKAAESGADGRETSSVVKDCQGSSRLSPDK